MKKSFASKFLCVFLSAMLTLSSISALLPSFNLLAAEGEEEALVLDDVQNLNWVEDSSATASWDAVAEANYYRVVVTVFNEEEEIGFKETGTTACELDVQQEIHSIVGPRNYSDVQVKVTVYSQFLENSVVVSESIGASTDLLTYSLGISQIHSPTNVYLSEDYVLSFDVDDTFQYAENTYIIGVDIYNNSGSLDCLNYVYVSLSSEDMNNRHFTRDIKDSIRYLYDDLGVDEELNVACYVKILSANDNYLDSNPSEYSNAQTIAPFGQVISAPTNVCLSDEGVLSFDVDDTFQYVDPLLSFEVRMSFDNGETVATVYGLAEFVREHNLDGNHVSVDLNSLLKWTIEQVGYARDVYVSCRIVRMRSIDSSFGPSEDSEWSNYVLIPQFIFVEEIDIAPSRPVVYVGGSTNVNSVIVSDNVYVDNFREFTWSVEDTTIATIDQNGCITGVSAGTTNVIATIGDVSASVPLTVYEISTDIVPVSDRNSIFNFTDDVISELINSDIFEVDGIAINMDDYESIRENLLLGLERDDQFEVNISVVSRSENIYENDWNQIQLPMLTTVPEFACIYSANVELAHLDRQGNEYLIGNIIDYDNGLAFSFDLPENLPAVNPGCVRSYYLLSVCDGVFEPINANISISEEEITVITNHAGDFILCYVDLECIDDVSNLLWIDESSATASWDSVGDANYYRVDVSVYEEGKYLGTVETGTTDTELDVQQEIHNILGERDFDVVQVQITVYAQVKENDFVVKQSNGVTSSILDYYKFRVYRVSAPTNLVLTDDYVLSFDIDRTFEYANRRITIYFKYSNRQGAIGIGTTITDDMIVDGRVTVDVSNDLVSHHPDSGEVDTVHCFISVRSNHPDYLDSEWSENSNDVEVYDGKTKITAPSNIHISDDYILEFDYDESFEYSNHQIEVMFAFFDEEPDFDYQYIFGRYITLQLDDYEYDNGHVTTDVSDFVLMAYGDSGLTNVPKYVYCMVSIPTQDRNYVASDYSVCPEYPLFIDEVGQLDCATNLHISDDYIIEFDIPENFDYRNWQIFIYSEFSYMINSYGQYLTLTEEQVVDGHVTIDFSSYLRNNFRPTGKVETVHCKIRLLSGDIYLRDSEYTEFSNSVEITDGRYKVNEATNLHLSNDYVLSFDVDETFAYSNNIAYVRVEFEGIYKLNSYMIPINSSDVVNGRVSINVVRALQYMYRESMYNGDAKMVRCYVLLESGNSAYVDSEFSEASNYIWFTPIIDVETINLAPESPIIYLGNSYYLGKTITPVDAYYEDIEWTSDDPSIVTVDENGLITGVSVGSTYVTARIGDVTDSVLVTVYDISSNIEDETERDTVTDVAGDIIDDIANNDNPNLDNTDVDPSDVEDIRDDILEGIENGDEFFTDIVGDESDDDSSYRTNWGQVQQAAKALNAEFAGLYTVEVEIYHKNGSGHKQHVANITEFEDEITFTFDLPTGMHEVETGYARRYILVRVHNGEMEAITADVDYITGKLTTRSNKFSDFILVYVDEQIDSTLLGHNLILDGSIGVNFYMDLSEEVVAAGNAYMEFTMANGTVSRMNVSDAVVDTRILGGSPCYIFTCYVAAAEISDSISAQLVIPGEEEMRGKVYVYSVQEYIDYINEHSDEAAYREVAPLLEAMSVYGAYADNYFRDGNNEISEANVEAVRSVTDETLSSFEASGRRQGRTVMFEGSNLYLQSETMLRLYFSAPAGTENIQFFMNGQEVTAFRYGPYYCIDIDNIPAAELDDIYEITIKIDGEVDCTISHSVMSYCYNTLSVDVDDVYTVALQDVLRALYLYNEAANSYFGR